MKSLANSSSVAIAEKLQSSSPRPFLNLAFKQNSIADQVPRWSDAEQRSSLKRESGDQPFSSSYFPDPLTSHSGTESGGIWSVSRFPVDHEINSKIYLWRGNPWNLKVDAVVNSTNENLDEAHNSPRLHAAAGLGLAEECATLVQESDDGTPLGISETPHNEAEPFDIEHEKKLQLATIMEEISNS